MISAAAEKIERQKELHMSLQNIQERENDMKVLHQEVDSINHCADKAVENSDTAFTELTTYDMKGRQSELRPAER